MPISPPNPLAQNIPSPYEVAAQTLKRFASEVAQQIQPTANTSPETFLQILREMKNYPDTLHPRTSYDLPSVGTVLNNFSPTAKRALNNLARESDLFGMVGAVAVPEAAFVSVWNKLPKLAESIATKYHISSDTAVVDDLITAASESITPKFASGLPEGTKDVEKFLTDDAANAMVSWAKSRGHVPTHVSITPEEGTEKSILDVLEAKANSNPANFEPINSLESIASSAPPPVDTLSSIFRGDKTKSFLKKTLMQGKSQTQALREMGYDLFHKVKPALKDISIEGLPRYSQIAAKGGVPTGNVARGATAKGRELLSQVQDALYSPISQQLEDKLGRVPSAAEVKTELFNMLSPATQLKRANASINDIDNAINTVLSSERADSPLRVVFGGRMNLQARSEALPLAKRQKFIETAVDPAKLYLIEGRSPLEIAKKVGIPTNNTVRLATFSKHLENLTNKVFNTLNIDRTLKISK